MNNPPNRLGKLLLTRVIALVILFTAFGTLAADTLISADNTSINYYGRFDFSDPKAPRFNWSGATIEIQVSNTNSVGMQLTDGAGYYDIEIDGQRQSTPVYADSWSSKKYTLVTSLSSDAHVIRIIRRNEPYWAIATFGGVYLSDGGEVMPLEKPVRKMEFCGDSWTAGYFIEACGDQQAHTNVNLTWARLTSKAFHAQDVILAESGIGLFKSLGGKSNFIQKYAGTFDTTGGASTPLWDFSSWIPDVVCIFLGINDKSAGATDTEYTDAVHSFITTIRGNYPNTPILFISYTDCMDKATQSAVAAETTSLGHEKIYFMECKQQVNGCSWHPDIADAQAISEAVIAEVKKITGWNTDMVAINHTQTDKPTRLMNGFNITRINKGTIALSTDSGVLSSHLSIHRSDGKILQRIEQTLSGTYMWNTSQVPEGLYFVGARKTGWTRILIK